MRKPSSIRHFKCSLTDSTFSYFTCKSMLPVLLYVAYYTISGYESISDTRRDSYFNDEVKTQYFLSPAASIPQIPAPLSKQLHPLIRTGPLVLVDLFHFFCILIPRADTCTADSVPSAPSSPPDFRNALCSFPDRNISAFSFHDLHSAYTEMRTVIYRDSTIAAHTCHCTMGLNRYVHHHSPMLYAPLSADSVISLQPEALAYGCVAQQGRIA